jgi:putative molybdopterin biosynthesis enzyme moaB
MDRRRKPAIREPRPEISLEEMRAILENITEIESATGIRYVKLHVTPKMIIGIRESSGKEFTINLNDLYRAYQECLRFTSPEVKKYIFMGHSPAVALLRMLQNHETC